MGDAQWAVDSTAVFEWHDAPIVPSVAWIAHVVRSKAAKESNRAAVHALPVDLHVSVLLASGLACAKVLEQTLLALEVFLLGLGLLSVLSLSHAVDETAEVWLLAVVALVEGSALEGVCKLVAMISMAWIIDADILEDALSLGLANGLLFDLALEAHEWDELLGDRLATEGVDRGSSTAWALHESESQAGA